MTSSHTTTFRTIAILWIVWGLVHALAGTMVISQNAAGAIAAIADAVDPALLAGPYHDAVVAVINQHGFNLLWISITTIVSAVFIWRGAVIALFVAGLVGGLADVGYFLFMDLGGFVNFVPGKVMTLVSATAIILSIWVWHSNRNLR